MFRRRTERPIQKNGIPFRKSGVAKLIPIMLCGNIGTAKLIPLTLCWDLETAKLIPIMLCGNIGTAKLIPLTLCWDLETVKLVPLTLCGNMETAKLICSGQARTFDISATDSVTLFCFLEMFFWKPVMVFWNFESLKSKNSRRTWNSVITGTDIFCLIPDSDMSITVLSRA